MTGRPRTFPRPRLPRPLRLLRPGLAASCVALAALLAPGAAAPQSLECNGYLIGRGDSRLSVLQKCGPPLDRQPLCIPVLQPQWLFAPYDGGGPGVVMTPQCMPVEDWTYDRGQGSFLGIVRIRNGTVESVRDGERLR